MTNNVVIRIAAAIVLIVAVLGLGGLAYGAGVAQGMTAGARLPAGAQLPAGDAAQALPYRSLPGGVAPFGFGFLSVLVPLFLIMLVFWALRWVFGCAPYPRHWWFAAQHPMWGMHRMAGRGEWCRDVPEMVEEWHRKMHEKQSASDMGEKPSEDKAA